MRLVHVGAQEPFVEDAKIKTGTLHDDDDDDGEDDENLGDEDKDDGGDGDDDTLVGARGGVAGQQGGHWL